MAAHYKTDNNMKITWYGQASFGIESAIGTMIVTDPYNPEKSGFKPFRLPVLSRGFSPFQPGVTRLSDFCDQI